MRAASKRDATSTSVGDGGCQGLYRLWEGRREPDDVTRVSGHACRGVAIVDSSHMWDTCGGESMVLHV